MKVIAVIPARYDSKRFPGKPIAKICGKPLIQWVWEKSRRVKSIDRTIIATDDKRIFNTAKSFGAEVMLTSKKCKSGTDRVAEIAKKIKCDIVVNIQGDEPLISPVTIEKTVKALMSDKSAVVSTPVCRFHTKDELNNPHTAKVVVDNNNHALYFSRSVIPRPLFTVRNLCLGDFYKHIGIYVFRKNFLLKFVKLPASRLENIERLEQLRILENGYQIKTVLVNDDTIPVDRPCDIKKVIRRLVN
ncbi:MAG: 3-deoxy-manno-octulosonate cytidylyltransferase [Elusimicrobia bacterium CG_4_10_14_0_8_um_filter_37_32]|nr:MAG: 3-deoxy-manno-octulosonate cytidylyltransferase [Elusimicrobia bacterium CG_4_10_14_0_8_um_filter_37_32]